MIPYSIYVVDDEQSIRDGICLSLEDEYTVKAFPSAEDAIDALQQEVPDLILLDIGLPGMSGIEAFQKINKISSDIIVIIITAYEDVKTVISAMKLGAYDYVVKPIHMEALSVTIRNALDTIRLRKEVQMLQEAALKENLPCFIGRSDTIQDVMEFIRMVAKSPDTPILILGETGTGKELLAGAIHYRSPNFKGPLITVNCAAIPGELLESELFGYKKGAFSGASASGKKGLIEEAEGGTLFLDEVGDLSMEAQAKLLRFLESGEFYRVGETRKRIIQTRVVSATNKDIETMIRKELFRNDLYFRLGVIKIRVPSLNERREDVLPIAEFFLREFNVKFGKAFTGISPEAREVLVSRNWTGNVRELKNLIERAVLVGTEPELTVNAFGLEHVADKPDSLDVINTTMLFDLPPTGIDLDELQQTIERHFLERAYEMAEGNESKAAKLLNMNHHTYRYRRKKSIQK